MISGHCIPKDNLWMNNLGFKPLSQGTVDYVYGRQIGGPELIGVSLNYLINIFPLQA